MPRPVEQVFNFVANARTKDIDDVRDELDAVADATDELGEAAGRSAGNVEKAEKRVGMLGKAAGLATKALAGIAAVGIAAGLALVGTAARDFMAMESAMNRVEAQTGLTGAALDEFRGVAETLFTQGYGESFDDVAAALQEASAITDLSGKGLEELTKRALVFSDVFDRDITESVRTADTMAEQFGGNASKMFDILTTGFQETGDPAGDLLDTFNEYSANFKDLGLDANDMLSILNSGLEAGARNTDDIADGVREFGIRMRDGTSAASLWELGLDGITAAFRRGEITGDEMFTAVIDGLKDIEDPLERNRLGIDLFGTKWEDAGEQVFLALETTDESLKDVAGATTAAGAAMQRGLGPAWTRFTRTIRVALATAIGPLITRGLEVLTPLMEDLGVWLATVGIPKIAKFAGVIAKLTETAIKLGAGLLNAVGGGKGIINILSTIVDLFSAGLTTGLEFGRAVFDQAVLGAQRLWGWIDDLAGLVGIDLGSAFTDLKDLLGEFTDDPFAVLKDTLDRASEAARQIVASLGVLGTLLLAVVVSGFQRAAEAAGVIVDSVVEISKISIAAAVEEFNKIADSAAVIASSIVEISKYSLAQALSGVDPKAFIIIAGSLAFMAAGPIVSGIGSLATNLAAMVTSSAAGGVGLLTMVGPLALVAGLVYALQNDFGGLSTNIEKAGKDIREGDVDGAFQNVANALLSIPKGIATEIGDIIGVDVPGGLKGWNVAFAAIGVMIGWAKDQIVNGFNSIKDAVLNFSPESISGVGDAILDGIGDKFIDLTSWLGQKLIAPLIIGIVKVDKELLGGAAGAIGLKMVTGIFNAIIELGTWVKEKLIDPLTAAIFGVDTTDLTKAAVEIGNTILGAIIDGILAAPEAIFNALKSLIPTAQDMADAVVEAVSGGGGNAVQQAAGWVEDKTGIHIPGMATGGNVAGGRPVVVGETGPELFYPRVSGSILSNRDSAAALAGSGGTMISFAGATMNFYGVQNVRDLKNQIEIESKRQNQHTARRR